MSFTFDSQWHVRALNGDPEAIAALGRHMIKPLYRFCIYRVGGDRHRCEDVVQETMCRAIGQLRLFDPGRGSDNIFPWLTGLARNEIRRVLSRVNSVKSLEALWARMDRDLQAIYAKLNEDPFGDEVLQQKETQQIVNVTMSQLPPLYRDALEAKYVEGVSVRDIAAQRGVSEKAIESQLTRARQAFRDTFLALTNNLPLELDRS